MKIICKNCKKEFNISPSRLKTRKYCSVECYRDDNYGKKQEYICAGCGKQFTDYITNGERKYCSKQCQTENKINPKGKESSRWNSVLVKCKSCGKEFYCWASNKNKKYCSRKCFTKDISGKYPKNLKGKRGTKPRTYHLTKRNKHGNAFDREWRIKVFKRDDYTCQGCGIRGGRLQAHHIKPYREYPELRHDIDNGQTLCIDCHKQTDTYGWSKYWHKRDSR